MGKKFLDPDAEGLVLCHFCLTSYCRQNSVGRSQKRLETMDLQENVSQLRRSLYDRMTYLDRLLIKFKAIFCDQELLHVLALIALKLDHLAHLTIGDNGAIAGCTCQSVAVCRIRIVSYRTSS